MKKLFIILPVYKGDKLDFIKLSVESILDQTYKDFVLLVVKDGFLTAEQEKYFSTLPNERLQYLQLNQNKGLPTALNEGVREAIKQGANYIARMDSDDIALSNRIEEQLKYLEENLEVDVLGSCVKLINDSGEIIGQKNVKHEVSFEDMISNCELIHPAVIFRKCFFQKYGFYDEKLLKSQDYDLWLRALKGGVIIHNLNKKLLLFRYEVQIISRRKKEQDYNIEIKRKYLKGFNFYRSIIKHLAIKYFPTFIIKIILKRKLK